MKRAVSFSLAVAVAAGISGAFVLFTVPEGRTNIAKLQSWWTGPRADIRPPAAIPTTFALLNVIDDTRHFLTPDEQKALFAGLSDHVRDPLSMEVRRLRRTNGNRYGVCGEVNATNGFGGYVGFIPFAGALAGDRTVIDVFSPPTEGPVSDYEKREWAGDMEVTLAKLGCPD
jgi:hypothetical protein